LKGTNRKALESEIDVLAHPGIMNEDDARLAVERNISVEISGRSGHSFSNGRVVRLWYEYGFPLVLNTDTHSPENLIDDSFAEKLIISAGVKPQDVKKVLDNSLRLARKLL
jgi:histidinol phosphatase-like PHP family hydrolase